MSEIRETRRAAIMQATLEEFCAVGYDGARMDRIARRAGIGKSTVYEYFPSKLELVTAVVDWIIEKIKSKLGEIFSADRPLRETIEDYLQTTLHMIRSLNGRTAFMPSDPNVVEVVIGRVRGLKTYAYPLVHSAVQRAQETGEIASDLSADRICDLLVVLPNPQLLVLSGDGSESRIAALTDLLFRGLAPRGGA